MQHTCHLDGEKMQCTITADRDLTAPMFCFSGMSPITATAGGKRVKGVGSYTEIALPDLVKGQPHDVTLEYCGGFKPANRAWLPLGPYLRVGKETFALPPTPAGVRRKEPQSLPPFDGLRITPQPTSFAPTSGTLKVSSLNVSDDAFDSVHELAKRRDLGTFLSKDGTPVRIINDDSANDAYQITITPDDIEVRASGYGGRFYAAITLLTLMNTHDREIPCGTITDAPRFGWRGQHLDTARHYYQPQTILDLLDIMALMKLNRFHWHFADDEAFRLEIDSLPELWQKTAVCGEGHLMPALFSGKIEAGGSYSKQVALEIIAHAAALNIEVLPEIEAPAHALATTFVYPETRDPADNGPEVSVQGYLGNVLNPAMPKTWEVLNAIVTEVGALFPFGHLHLGCDELPEDTWMGSPKARELMKAEGLETTKDLQGWTINKLASTVAANGIRPAAWEEAAQGSNGGIGNNAILFTWTGQGPGLEAAKRGYDVVMCPAQHVYLDMAQTNDPDDWGANWAAYVSLADTIAWEPVPDPALAERIIGVQGQFWSEFTTSDDQLWPMIMPRILGVATKAWQSQDITPVVLAQLAGHYTSLSLNLPSTGLAD
ncbi:beta-N-acetylhexosaminidase [Falsihalocynthiibacter sp. SS001]|uniref:beta-N-acetylhexosaminidase n=1 Tax=Falsihalocynthiibacter sp. SS001 TaxID=3349698 RepID=UPI0036D4402C